MTAVFPFDRAGRARSRSRPRPTRSRARRALDDEERQIRLRELFGSVAGMVHLSRDTREWTLYWPSAVYPVLLCSVQRLPAVCNLAARPTRRSLHLAASPGDVVIGLASQVR